MFKSEAGVVEIQRSGTSYTIVWWDKVGNEVNCLAGRGEPPTADKLNSIEPAFHDVHSAVAGALQRKYETTLYKTPIN